MFSLLLLGFTPHDPTEDTESWLHWRCRTRPARVSPLTIRQRILKALLGLLLGGGLRGFTPHDPTEDTESKKIRRPPEAATRSFTPHDPTEDTESSPCPVSCPYLSSSFTPHDPTEDTESTAPIWMDRWWESSFTPHDPTEDTERLRSPLPSGSAGGFHPSRSDRGY